MTSFGFKFQQIRMNRLLIVAALVLGMIGCEKEEESPDNTDVKTGSSFDYTGCWERSGSYTLCFSDDYDATYEETGLAIGRFEMVNDTLFYDGGNGFIYWVKGDGNILEYNYQESNIESWFFTRKL